ncbi:MAG: cation diffusion facilitator family transporter [Desulfopila sp.]
MKTSPAKKKLFAAKLSISTAITLSVLKFTVGLLTGSMAVLSSAIDSMLDILMSGVNLLAIRHADQPADESHAYGHGKFETMAALVQALVIGGSGVWILIESARRLFNGSAPSELGSGIIVLAISLVMSWAISRYLQKVARETDSSALQADSLHFSMDVYTNLALVAGLVAIRIFQLSWLDSFLSLLVGAYILYEALKLARHALDDVLDAQLPEDLRNTIEEIVASHGGNTLSCHNLRTRRAGSHKIIDFHLTVCKNLTVDASHRITEILEEEIQQALDNSDITIHVEPCRRTDCQEEPTSCDAGMIHTRFDRAEDSSAN